MLVVITVFPSNAYAAGSKPKKSNVTIKATILKDKTVLLKISNKNSQTIGLDYKVVYKNGKTVIVEDYNWLASIKGKTTVYDSLDYSDYTNGIKPTSVKVKFSIGTNYGKPQIKCIKNVITARINSIKTETNEFGKYQTLNVCFKSISKKFIVGDVIVLFYSGNNLVGSDKGAVNGIYKGETLVYVYSPFMFPDEEVNIDSIKIVQQCLKYE